MFRLLKYLLVAFAAVVFAENVKAFSLMGPRPAWQTPRLGYGISVFEIRPRPDSLRAADFGGVMNRGEEYRLNTPFLTYAFDQSFLNYFGVEGVDAVEKAIKILNDLPPYSQMSADLSEFPLEAQRINFLAQALYLYDIKSVALGMLVQQMGLASPERYVWTLRDVDNNPTLRFTNFFVIPRNFEITPPYNPSGYINGKLYTYWDVPQYSPSPGWVTDVFPIGWDPRSPVGYFTTAASIVSSGPNGFTRRSSLEPGGFFTGLTRDDVGGLRYLYRTDLLQYEPLLSDVQEVLTNKNAALTLDTLDLSLLIERSQATTNTPADLLSFPGYTNLWITSVTNYLTNVITTNIIAYYTNFPYALDLSNFFPTYATNYVTNTVRLFDYTFGNVVTNSYSPNRVITDQIVDVVLATTYTPGAPVTFVTNLLSSQTYTTNLPSGDFYIVPTNLLGFDVVSRRLTNVLARTNVISEIFANAAAYTNTNALPIELDTFDLGTFYQQAHWTTNTAADLLALYPGLVITKTNGHLTNVVTTNIISYFTNYPWAPEQVFVEETTTNVVFVFDYTFANVVINGSSAHFSSFDSWETKFPGQDPFPNVPWQDGVIRKLEVVPALDYTPGLGNTRTNVLDYTVEKIPVPAGDFFIVPTDLLGYAAITNVLNGVASITNISFYSRSLLTTNEVQDLRELSTIDLITFSEQVLTNDPAALKALPQYKDLLITSSNRVFTNIIVTNITRYLTNTPFDPVTGTTQHVATNITLSTNIATNWVYTFGNVVTNNFFTSMRMRVEQQETVFDPYSPPDAPPHVETTTNVFTVDVPNGTIYIVPTNLFGYHILFTQFIDVQRVTNVLSSTTNFFQTTNVDQTLLIRFTTNYYYGVYPIEFVTTNDFASNQFGIHREIVYDVATNVYEVYPIQFLSTNELGSNILGSRRELVRYFTNQVLEFYPIEVRSPQFNVGKRAGLDHIQFIRVLTEGTNFIGYTNSYIDRVIPSLTNNVIVEQSVRRVSSRPDILFTAEDLGTVFGIPVPYTYDFNYISHADINGQASMAGPGTIVPQIRLAFGKVGPYYYNFQDGIDQFLQQPAPYYFAWASFDGTTNPPVVFPSGVSITNLESQFLSPAP